MRGYMFRNRWFALLFVGVTLAGVTRLIGTHEDGGTLDDAKAQLIAQQRAAQSFTEPAAPSEAEESGDDLPVEFTPDEELIDPAVGEDPTPIDEFAESQTSPEDDTTDTFVEIVSQAPADQPPAP
jgi:hypothetical protein